MIIHDANTTAKQLCEDLDKIKEWAFQSKRSLNPDQSKQEQEVIFTCNIKKVVHAPILIYDNPVQQTSFITKTLGSYIRHIFNF